MRKQTLFEGGIRGWEESMVKEEVGKRSVVLAVSELQRGIWPQLVLRLLQINIHRNRGECRYRWKAMGPVRTVQEVGPHGLRGWERLHQPLRTFARRGKLRLPIFLLYLQKQKNPWKPK
jgi:hypothetical protein